MNCPLPIYENTTKVMNLGMYRYSWRYRKTHRILFIATINVIGNNTGETTRRSQFIKLKDDVGTSTYNVVTMSPFPSTADVASRR